MIHIGDCLNILSLMESCSIDSLVTDPPAGIGFMGKAWDSDKGGRDGWIAWLTNVMRECHRVLKPGAHGLVWAIPRTSHWTMTALENAGFEIRDVITHLFGTGFPKSLDISKAIDKEAGAKREILGRDPNQSGRKKNSGIVAGQAQYDQGETERIAFLTVPATDCARQWQGFGTALKPACEFWILARKPISEKTVAKNVLKWGTGALNIEACRIETVGARPATTQGRFPANLILDEEAAAALDEQNEGRGAARFFYVAKASRSDRGEDNKHPTVKSTKLMSYLCRLIAPPGGTVLDPFMGSGSTGVAAHAEGFKFIGIEKEPEYCAIAERRLV